MQDTRTRAQLPTLLGDPSAGGPGPPRGSQGSAQGGKGVKEGRGRSPRAAARHTATSSFSHCAPAGVRPKGLGLAFWAEQREGLMAKG